MEESQAFSGIRRLRNRTSSGAVENGGVNVGGHRTFRPTILARELSAYDVVNVGAAGTFVSGSGRSRSRL